MPTPPLHDDRAAAQMEHERLGKSITEDGDVLAVRAWLQETDWDGQALDILSPTFAQVNTRDYRRRFMGYGFAWEKNNDDFGDAVEISPLHLAISHDRLEIIDALLRAPAVDVELRSTGCHDRLQTPLEFAVCSGADVRIIERLLQHGANARIRNNGKQQTLLHMAALDDLVEPGRVLLRHDRSFLLNAKDGQGQTALLMATISQSQSMQKLLLQHGADANIRNHGNGRTALHEEVSHDEPSAEMVSLMITHGANVEARTQSGATACMLTMRRSTENDRDGRFLRASVAVLRVLLETGRAAVDMEDDYGETPLHCAHNAAFLQVLLEFGNADINHTNSRGETTLHVACQVTNNTTRVPMLLHEFGANRHVVDAVHGRTPLHYAARSGNDTALLALLEEGEDQDAVLRSMTARCTRHGRTPLHDLVWAGTAARGPQPLILEQYLSRAISDESRATLVNARDNREWTPLHWACFQGDADAVRVLIQAGANVRAVDSKGRTPLHLACLTFINAKEWDESIDIPRQILTSEQPMSQQDWDQMRASDYGEHMTSFRGCGPPGGWFITYDVPKVLLYEGRANPSVLDNDGNLPFFLAAVLLDEQPQLLDTVYMNIRAGAHVRLA